MRNIFGAVKQQVLSLQFALAVVVLVALCGCQTVMEGMLTDAPTVWTAIFTYSYDELFELGEYASSFELLMNFTSMEWFKVLFPVLVSFPGVYAFADEWMGGSFYMTLPRCGRLRYTLKTVLSAAITGVLVVVVSILVFMGIIYIKFPSLIDLGLDVDTSTLMYFYGETAGARAMTFGKIWFNTALNGAVCAGVSVLLVAVLKDRFFALTIPMMAEYIGMKLAGLYNMQIFEIYGFEGYPTYTYLPYLIEPSSQLDMAGTFTNYFGVSYVWYALYLLLLLVIVTFILYRIIKRRIG